MEPLVGFEPTTYSLRMNCSTPELQRQLPLNDNWMVARKLLKSMPP